MNGAVWSLVDFFLDDLPAWLGRHPKARMVLMLLFLYVPPVKEFLLYLLHLWTAHRVQEFMQMVGVLVPHLFHLPAAVRSP